MPALCPSTGSVHRFKGNRASATAPMASAHDGKESPVDPDQKLTKSNVEGDFENSEERVPSFCKACDQYNCVCDERDTGSKRDALIRADTALAVAAIDAQTNGGSFSLLASASLRRAATSREKDGTLVEVPPNLHQILTHHCLANGSSLRTPVVSGLTGHVHTVSIRSAVNLQPVYSVCTVSLLSLDCQSHSPRKVNMRSVHTVKSHCLSTVA